MKTNRINSLPVMEKDPVFTTHEAIEYLRTSKPAFFKYIRLGKVRTHKAGKGWRVLQSGLYRFLKGRGQPMKLLINTNLNKHEL